MRSRIDPNDLPVLLYPDLGAMHLGDAPGFLGGTLQCPSDRSCVLVLLELSFPFAHKLFSIRTGEDPEFSYKCQV